MKESMNISYFELKDFCNRVAETCDYYHVGTINDLGEVFTWKGFHVEVELFEDAVDLRDSRVMIYDSERNPVCGSALGLPYEIDPGYFLRQVMKYLENIQ